MTVSWAIILGKILEPLGFSILTDATTGGIRHIVCRKKIKEEEQQRKETHDGVQEALFTIRDLKEMILSEPSDVFRKAAADLQPLIANLHVRTAHNIFSDLRKDIKSEDRRTLARIDYYRGCCSRYVNREASISEYNLAYQEMVDNTICNGGTYDPDIVAGKVFVLCIGKEKDASIQMASRLKDIERMNTWAWVPDLLFSDDLESAYNNLPEDIDKVLVLANATQIGNNEKSLGVNIQTYDPQIPDTLTFENIPIWLFALSVLTNKYIPEWNAESFMGDVEVGSVCESFHDASSKFLSLVDKTELGELSPDIRLFNTITGYRISKDPELLSQLCDCKCSQQFLTFKQLSYTLFLAKANRFEEAKAYLSNEDIQNDCSIFNMRFYLSVASADRDYALITLKSLVEKGIELPGNMLVFLLLALHDHYDYLKEYAGSVVVIGDVNARVYYEILQSLGGRNVDVDYLLKNQLQVDFPLRPFVAIALNSAGKTPEALDLSESCVRDGYIDLCSNIYFSLLKKTHSYIRLNAFLKKVREGGFTENPLWLREEYVLAMKEEDFPRMLDIAIALYRLNPQNPSYYVCLLSQQYQNGNFEQVRIMVEQLGDYEIVENDVDQVFNVLLLSDMPAKAVDFLYTKIRTLPFSERLSLLFHEACLNPKTGSIIKKEYEAVEVGLYVTYKHNGNVASSIIVDGQRTSCMIGRKPNETVVEQDRLGNDETYEIIVIHNKYYELMEEVYKDIYDNKYQSAFSFSMEDIQPDDIFGFLAKAAGRDEKWMETYKQNLEDYKHGKQTISSFFHGNDTIAEFYNHLFGDFKVYSVQVEDLTQLYYHRGISIKDLEFVLDLPSVILLYELHIKYGLDYPFPMIVSQGIVNQIEASIAKERYATPAGVYQKVTDFLAPIEIEEGETWLMSRLQGVLAWIKNNTHVEVAHEMVELDASSIFDKSRYMAIEFQSVFLAGRDNRAFVSVDLAMTLALGEVMTVSDVNYLIYSFCIDYYGQISDFLLQANIYGCNLDADYVITNYEKHKKGELSTFNQCRENLSYCPSQYTVVLGFCSILLSKPVVTTADRIVAENLLSAMFKLFDRHVGISILASAYKQAPHMRRELLTAFKTTYPIIV